MFGDKCARCGNRVKKSYDFCPSCGANIKNEEDYGFLGKNDDFDIKMPFGFKLLFKPLLKELQKQMSELDNELKEDVKKNKDKSLDSRPKMNHTSFSINIKAPGMKPIKLDSAGFPGVIGGNDFRNSKNVQLVLPKISKETLDKVKDLPRTEPEASVRRLSDKVIYELFIPGVDALSKVNIRQLDSTFEVKAVSRKEVYSKSIKVTLPLVNYFLANEKLVLEFASE